MESLYKGIHKFKDSYFKKEEEFFRRISAQQRPTALFFTCSDSRIDPNLVTQSRPGELFIVRNVGNIIPPYGATGGINSAGAALEYAALTLKVTDVIVCGHSGCGAIEAMQADPKTLEELPNLREWLKLANPVKQVVETYYSNMGHEEKTRIAEEENVLVQLDNIQTYPFIARLLAEGSLFLHGWYYEIATGEVFSYNPQSQMYENIVRAKKP